MPLCCLSEPYHTYEIETSYKIYYLFLHGMCLEGSYGIRIILPHISLAHDVVFCHGTTSLIVPLNVDEEHYIRVVITCVMIYWS